MCREWDSNPHAHVTVQEILSLWCLPFHHPGIHLFLDRDRVHNTILYAKIHEHSYRPGGEEVTQESAKLLCAGSIPAQASRHNICMLWLRESKSGAMSSQQTRPRAGAATEPKRRRGSSCSRFNTAQAPFTTLSVHRYVIDSSLLHR
ncbi:MAG: hypothetical protein JWO50_549 [Candidatus Kaiserbacteria bacterium]|nr:hypothetical protein [Candidatus Kaiserbacteria bacterium]